ncbi:hypothetical protein [Pseudobutyrivibrio sp.]
MSLTGFMKARAIMDGDILTFVYNRLVTGSPGGDPDSIYDKFLREFMKLKFWLWDPFDFEAMTVDDAITAEAPNHVVYNPSGVLTINTPMVTFKLVEQTASYYKYAVSVYDESDDSEVAEEYRQKFKMEPTGTGRVDSYYRYDYEMTV